MSKNKWQLVLEKDVGSIVVETFPTKDTAQEELRFRNSLTRAMGYSPDVNYSIRKIN
tara:strand:+ start:550 stop:720 length:171 start_codon:yes stop_codon:yes gene_type:complete